MFFTNFFNIKKVEVTGNESLTTEEITALAEFKLNSNIFLQDISSKTKLLKETYPRISSVNFQRKLPDKVVINIVEKKPVLIALSPPNYLFVDAEGMVLDKFEDISDSRVPIYSSYHFDDQVKIGQLLVEDGLKRVISLLKQVPFNKQYLIKEISIKDDQIIIYPNNYLKAILGNEENLNVKLNTLEELLNDTTVIEGKIEYIDLSTPEKPIIK